MTGLYTAQTLVAGATNVLVVVAAIDLLDAGDGGVGYLNAALGVGGIVGGFVALVLAARGRLGTDLAVGLVLCGLPLAALGLATDIPVALAALALIGLGNAIVDVSALTLLQRIVGDDVLGRVLGTLEGLLLAAIGIGALLAPRARRAVGAEDALVISGLVLPVVTSSRAGGLRSSTAPPSDPRRPACCAVSRSSLRCPSRSLEQLAAASTETSVRAGEVVIRAGDPGDLFYVIEAGEVEIEGRRFGPGESFGEIALLRDVPRTATVTAATDAVLHALDRDEFLAAVTGHGHPCLRGGVVAARLGGFGGVTPV